MYLTVGHVALVGCNVGAIGSRHYRFQLSFGGTFWDVGEHTVDGATVTEVLALQQSLVVTSPTILPRIMPWEPHTMMVVAVQGAPVRPHFACLVTVPNTVVG